MKKKETTRWQEDSKGMKIDENKDCAKKNLKTTNKQGLDILRKQIEDNGGKLDKIYRVMCAKIKIRREELALQKQSATNPSERKEIAKEQKETVRC